MSLESERTCILNRLWSVSAPSGLRKVIAGSAAMVLHGIEISRTPGDIDVFVSTEDWFELYDDPRGRLDAFMPDAYDARRANDPPYLIDNSDPEFPVHIFFAWRYRQENNWDIAAMMREATAIPEDPNTLVAPLEVVYQQKMQARRPKDLRDMALILEHDENRA